MKQRKSNANSTFNAKQNTYCSLQFCSCHLHYHPFSCFLVQIAIGPHYIKETPRIRYWCFPENQDPSSSGSRDWKCSLATESSCFFHSLAAYHVSEEIRDIILAQLQQNQVFFGHKFNSIGKKHKYISIEILRSCNDVLTHRTVNHSQAQKILRKSQDSESCNFDISENGRHTTRRPQSTLVERDPLRFTQYLKKKKPLSFRPSLVSVLCKTEITFRIAWHF